MSNDDETSVAPKEQINVRFHPDTGDQEPEDELPGKFLFIGDFLGREDGTPLAERKVHGVNKNSFAGVMEGLGLSVNVQVPDRLSEPAAGEEPDDIRGTINVRGMRDFEPASIIAQLPELRKVYELRQALIALKGPLGNERKFRERIAEILGDEEAAKNVREELGLGGDASTS